MTDHSQFPRLTRRQFTALSAGAVALAAAGSLGLPIEALAQRRKPGPDTVDLGELMQPGPLPELALGKADAPVTIVEYASMTCGHCASFHNKVFPVLKTKYVDTGQVRFIFREFPLDDRAAAASMLARCTGEGKTLPFVSVLFAKQDDWAFGRNDFLPNLLKYGKQAGFTEENFTKCLRDQKLLDDVKAVKERGVEKFGVSSTPTFFINGKRFSGAPTVEEFDKVLAPILKS